MDRRKEGMNKEREGDNGHRNTVSLVEILRVYDVFIR